MVIQGKHDKESSHDWTRAQSKNRIDHFERFISILKFPIFKSNMNEPSAKKLKIAEELKEYDNLDEILNSLNASKFKRDWIARRVDLIICPIDQFPFALLGNLYRTFKNLYLDFLIRKC